MTRLGRMVRNLLERLLSSYYEGPEPPHRIAEQVVAFAAGNPQATVEQWMRYTTALAQSTYRSGYVRGLEWAERNRHDFTWHAPMQPTSTQLAMVVPRGPDEFLASLPTDEARAKALDAMGRYQGNFRVVVQPRGKA